MDKDRQMLNTATTVPEWPQYAKMLFSSSNRIQQENEESPQQQIVCSPSPNTTFRKTHVPNLQQEEENKSVEGSNAFLDFINNQKKELEKVKHDSKNYLTPVFNGKTGQENQLKQEHSSNNNSAEDLDDGELEIVNCTKLLKNIYNQHYIETQIQEHIKIIQNQSVQVSVNVKTIFDIPKPIDKFINSFSISPHQNALQRFMIYFDKTKGIVYCSNLEMTQISEHNIIQPLSFSKSVCVDSTSKRFFLYNNRNNQICIYSLTEDRLLCRLQSYVPRLNPQLYFHESKQILLVLGGYHNQNKQKISSKIQIYKFNQSNIDLQPTIINLNISRFNPLISQFHISNKDYLLVVGGISKVSLLENSVFFNENQQWNKMANTNGQIIDLDQYSLQTVNVQNSRNLHLNSGHNIILKNKLITFLPNSQCIIELIMQNNSDSYVIKIQEQSDCLSNTFIKYFGKTKFNLYPESQPIFKSQPRIINNESWKMSASDVNLNTINTIQNINHIVDKSKGEQQCDKLKIKKDLQNKYCCPLI